MNYIQSHYSMFLCLHSPFQDLYGYATIVFFSEASKLSNVRSRKSGRRWRHDVHKRASKESLNTENVYRLSNHVSADLLHPLQLNFNSYEFLLRLKHYTSRRSSGEKARNIQLPWSSICLNATPNELKELVVPDLLRITKQSSFDRRRNSFCF